MTNALVIESIEIRRAPGIPEGFSLPPFGSGINVITGPNASGKSTTAQLLHQLFWKQETHGDAHIEVQFRYGGDAWTLRRDGRRIICHCNGEAKPLPVFDEPTDDTRDRYLLALHDLLRADDVAFARTIAREAAGGFDLDAAAKSLNYHVKPTSPQKLKEELERARAELHRMQGQQKALASREASLGEHHARANRARAADSGLTRLNQIELVLAADRDRDTARRALEALPEALARFRGDEIQTLRELEENEANEVLSRNRIEQQIGLATVELQDLGLPSELNLDIPIEAMVANLKALDTADQLAATHERERLAALKKRDLAVLGVAGLLDPGVMVEQSVALLDDLAEALANLDQAARSDEAQREIEIWIGGDEPPIDQLRVEEGIRALQAWLRAPDPDVRQDSFSGLLIAGMVFLVIEAALLGLLVHPAAFALMLVPAAILVMQSRRGPAPVDRRQEAMHRFARLELADPLAWQVAEVEQALDQLHYQAGAGVVQREKAMRWSDLGRKRADATRLRAETLAGVESLKQRLGITRELSAQSSAFVAQALREALSAGVQAQEAAGRLLAIREQRRDLLMAFNRQGELVGIATATDAADATALLQELQARVRRAAEIRHRLDVDHQRLDEQLLPALAAVERDRAALRMRTGIELLDEMALLAGWHDDWRTAKKQLDDADLTFTDRRSLLPLDWSLDDWNPERVAGERIALQHEASQYEPAMRAINAIEYELNEAKQGQSVERALASEANARTMLVRRRDDDIASALGALVVETVREQSDEANLPVVARKARERFSQITRGRYELKIVAGERPVFTAIDTISGIEQPLDQLSSATRVQLLLTVRAAFVETNERTAKLPLLLDETLANADESRAEAMIEAAFDLASEGRQLFYFTAQRDEVEKWRAIGADHPETKVTVIDLAAARHIPSQIRTDWLELPRVERVLPPEPDGMSRAHYRAAIGVPPVSLWSRGDGDLHLWYLVPDLPQLHRLLVADVSSWGQLRSYIDQGAASQLGLNADDADKMRAMAKLCSTIRDSARSGKGPPATAATLQASGAISEIYADRCLELLDLCDGDAARFVTRLKEKAILSFRAEKIEQLEQFFRDNGHIVDGDALAPDALAHRVKIELAPEMERGLISTDDLDRLMLDLALPSREAPNRDQPDRIEAAQALPML